MHPPLDKVYNYSYNYSMHYYQIEGEKCGSNNENSLKKINKNSYTWNYHFFHMRVGQQIILSLHL